MEIMAPQNMTLVDDGTPDVVVEFDCPACDEHVQYRFEATFVAAYSPGLSELVTSEWEADECVINH